MDFLFIGDSGDPLCKRISAVFFYKVDARCNRIFSTTCIVPSGIYKSQSLALHVASSKGEFPIFEVMGAIYIFNANSY